MLAISKIWRQMFKRSPSLAKVYDQGKGVPVIMLHGIGRAGNVWQHVEEGLAYFPCRVIAYDLLGFGASPKPENIDYNIDDHAEAVIASLEKLGLKQPCIIIGHSMGCLIAVRLARLRPDLVRHLVLYEMPLYEGLPEKRVYRLRLNLYARFYNWVINYQPQFDEVNQKRAERLARRIIGFEVNKETWQPFIKSLKNLIMNQTAAEDMKHVKAPMDVIYGTLDMFVIRGKAKRIFGDAADNVTSHNVRARHIISTKASQLIVQRTVAAMNVKASLKG
jgi:pimeloyl-ACP methyl ester carboxylesterase